MTRAFGHILLTGNSPQCVRDWRRTGKSSWLTNATGQQLRIYDGSLGKSWEKDQMVCTKCVPTACLTAPRVIDLYLNFVLIGRLYLGHIWG